MPAAASARLQRRESGATIWLVTTTARGRARAARAARRPRASSPARCGWGSCARRAPTTRVRCFMAGHALARRPCGAARRSPPASVPDSARRCRRTRSATSRRTGRGSREPLRGAPAGRAVSSSGRSRSAPGSLVQLVEGDAQVDHRAVRSSSARGSPRRGPRRRPWRPTFAAQTSSASIGSSRSRKPASPSISKIVAIGTPRALRSRGRSRRTSCPAAARAAARAWSCPRRQSDQNRLPRCTARGIVQRRSVRRPRTAAPAPREQ